MANRNIWEHNDPRNPGGVVTLGIDASGQANYYFDTFLLVGPDPSPAAENRHSADFISFWPSVPATNIAFRALVSFSDTLPAAAWSDTNIQAGQPVFVIGANTYAIYTQHPIMPIPYNNIEVDPAVRTTAQGIMPRLGRYLWVSTLDGGLDILYLHLYRLSGPNYTALEGLLTAA